MCCATGVEPAGGGRDAFGWLVVGICHFVDYSIVSVQSCCWVYVKRKRNTL